MSGPEGFFVLQSENKPVGEKPRVEKLIKGSLGGAARKKLGDISNLPQQPKPLTKVEKAHPESGTTKDEVDLLRKENVMLSKLLGEKNKIIELAGLELQKLRVHVQKLQQQNSQLAQSNSQMLMELNSGKERVRALQHELGCANCLLNAKKIKVEEKATIATCLKIDSQEGTSRPEEARESLEADREQKKPCTTKRKQQSKSLGSSDVGEARLKKKIENTRVLRRQSARFKSEEQKPSEDTFDAKAPMSSLHGEQIQEEASTSTSSPLRHNNQETNHLQTDEQMQEEGSTFTSSPVQLDNREANNLQTVEQMHEDGSTSTSSSVGNDEKESNDRPSITGRASLRPSRQAAKKVQSYKELPLKMKMRRPE